MSNEPLNDFLWETLSGSAPGDDIKPMLARVRHELRTPLNHILGYAELLEEQASDENRTEWATDLRKIQVAARRLLHLLTVLLSENNSGQTYRMPGTEQDGTGRAVLLSVLMDNDSVVSPVLRPTNAPADALRQQAKNALPILVVDDEPGNRDVLARMLAAFGFTVEQAPNGAAALEKMQADVYDAVFLDVLMPVMDGYATLQAIHADEVLQFTPVIMVSALDELETVAQCLAAGAEDFMPKPFNQTILQARLAATLDRKRLRDQEHDLLAELAEAQNLMREWNQKQNANAAS